MNPRERAIEFLLPTDPGHGIRAIARRLWHAAEYLHAKVKVAVRVALMLGLGAGWSEAAPSVTVIYPTGLFPADQNNVQGAIDLGGTVLLKATNTAGQPTAFNFGPPDAQVNGGVNIHTDVRIRGERVGQNTTTITGGFNPILCTNAVKSTIQGITFDGPLDSPIALIRSSGANIIGNHIKNIVPFPLPFGFTEIEGIFVSGSDDPQNAITGRVKIADNLIEISGGDFVNGMQFNEVAAEIEVSGNNVQFIESDGTVQTIGILVFRSHGRANIINNRVTMGPGDPGAFPVGIFAGGHPEARYVISLNTVVTTHPNADGMDIVGLSSDTTTEGAVVAANRITMQSMISTAGGVVFVGGVRDSLMSANRIEGTSGNALQILGLDSTLVADSNLALANNISRLSPLNGDIYLGPNSTRNLVAGRCSTYIDLGMANRVLCGSPLGPPPDASTEAANRARAMIVAYGDAIQKVRLDAMRNRR